MPHTSLPCALYGGWWPRVLMMGNSHLYIRPSVYCCLDKITWRNVVRQVLCKMTDITLGPMSPFMRPKLLSWLRWLLHFLHRYRLRLLVFVCSNFISPPKYLYRPVQVCVFTSLCPVVLICMTQLKVDQFIWGHEGCFF